MIYDLKVNYKWQSGGMCIHVGFYMMCYVWSRELRWWASPPQLDLLDLSHRTRVYVQESWVSSRSGLCLLWSDTHLQIPTERSFDLSRLRCPLNLCSMWCVLYHIPGSKICFLLWWRSKISDVVFLVPSYSSDRHFSKPRQLAIIYNHGLWHYDTVCSTPFMQIANPWMPNETRLWIT
jgi:hypothetical protein